MRDIYGFYADNAEKLLADEPIELLAGEGSAVVRRSAFGLGGHTDFATSSDSNVSPATRARRASAPTASR